MQDVRFDQAAEQYLADMQVEGRLNSRYSIQKYRATLEAHQRDVENGDPANVTREDVKRTLRRWANPNTRGYNRSILVSFFDWAMDQGVCASSPARQTRPPRRKQPVRIRLTEAEARRMLEAAEGHRETRAIFLALCAGLRNAELRGLQGRHFRRDGLVWVSTDIAKGSRERWVPVTIDLEPVVSEIRGHVADAQYVLPALGFHPPRSSYGEDLSWRPCSTQALRSLVAKVALRARVFAPVTPHVLRRAYADRVAQAADARMVQHLLGHARLESTEAYLGPPTMDELASAVEGVTYGIGKGS